MTKAIELFIYAGAVVITGILIFIWKKYITKKINKLNNIEIAPPIEHGFFINIQKNIKNKIPYIKLYKEDKFCEGRSELFKIMLLIKLKHWHNHIKDLTYVINNNLTNYELQQLIYRFTDSFIQEYIKEWEQEKIPEIVINKFNEWHKSKVDIYFQAIDDICLGHSYSSNNEKINAFLEINNAMLIFTIIDAEKTLGGLNGLISKIKFKNFKFI